MGPGGEIGAYMKTESIFGKEALRLFCRLIAQSDTTFLGTLQRR